MTRKQSRLSGAGRVFAWLAKSVEAALAEVPLSPAQYRLLAYLSRGASGTSRLADSLSVSRPNVTLLLNGLVEAGLVERRHNPGDRRQVHCSLTAHGRRTLTKADLAVERRLDGLLSHLGDDHNPEIDAHIEPSVELWREALEATRAARQAQALRPSQNNGSARRQ